MGVRAVVFGRFVGPILVGTLLVAGNVVSAESNSPQQNTVAMPSAVDSRLHSRGQPSDSTQAGRLVAASDVSADAKPKGLRARLVGRARSGADRLFTRAAAAFPAFCEDWERKLKDREMDNLRHVSWQRKNGWVTGTYVGYGALTSCTCKKSEGQPIGEVRYQEFTYYLLGKSVEEAERAAAKPISITNTLEIFNWEHGRWFY